MSNIKYILPIIIIFFISCNKEVQTEIPDSRTKIINASEINKKIKKGEDVTYKNATIIGDIDFTRSNNASLITGNLIKHYVNSAVIFYDCTFKGKILAVNNNKDPPARIKRRKDRCGIASWRTLHNPPKRFFQSYSLHTHNPSEHIRMSYQEPPLMIDHPESPPISADHA